MTGLLIAGTSSDAGKSLFVTGLCRVARRRGIDVAPFKSQNMSNNSMVCLDGSEIGRAQYLQATAAGVTPSSLLNPVLLKPGTDRRSFVVLRGQPHGTLEAGEYATSRRHLADAAYAAYAELAATHELIICEGAGSPAEINLRKGDYTNMGLARQFDLPTVLVGDIDRGGVLASIYGTWALLDDADRSLLAGYVINKFRGDQSILDPGLDDITGRTGLTNFGVLPYLHGVWVDGEDALEVGRWRNDGAKDADDDLTVAAVRLPRISNATDVDALAQEPGVRVVVTVDPREVERADIVVLPGSRSTLGDLAWLRETGIADVIARRAARGRPVLGICGGFQMLARTIDDDVEGDDIAPGLGLLPVDVRFHAEKVLGRPVGEWRGHAVDGYTIHHGRPAVDAGVEPFLDGAHVGSVWGTMWHGSLECDDFRRAWLAEVAREAGSPWRPREAGPGFGALRELMIETTADAIEAHIDVDALLGLAR
ncbi:MAG: cobyric acid synthase [Tessaracoccus sp.]|uniref:cobyric acid synthase n=1 Tax=Tessaracoccus sp. TaxID=1971211 RepID=UPI001EC2B81C|nr:cobyric acid synthase [Tessaracoccus sp.]MBK7820676.1 cobyric acid synthase [Tessaracoccus sp.]